MSRLLLIAVFLEVGVVLTVVPWTQQWDRNYFVETMPLVQVVAGDPYVRGAVSGLGVVNLLAGITELVSLILANRAQEPTTIRSDNVTSAK
jgi:hypothetical protein